MAKETKEFVVLPAKITDSIYASMADGNFHLLKDLPNFFDDFMAAPTAINGFDKIKQENIDMSIEEREGVRKTFGQNMPNVPESDRYDLESGLNGILSFVRFAWRKGYEAGKKEAETNLNETAKAVGNTANA